MAVRLYNECLEGITTTSPPCGYISPLNIGTKNAASKQRECTRYRFDTAKLKNYFVTNIILFYFLIIFKSEPTPILSLVSAQVGTAKHLLYIKI